LSLIVFSFIVKSFGQTTLNLSSAKDFNLSSSKDLNLSSFKYSYLKKSKAQKTIGWILLVTGAGMATYGLVNINNYTDNELGFNITGALIAIGGGVVAASSIPFFISSARNKRKAATLSFSTKKNLFLQQHAFACKMQPAIALKIAL
jgi:hypothetical protein